MAHRFFREIKGFICIFYIALITLVISRTILQTIGNMYIEEGLFVLVARLMIDELYNAILETWPLLVIILVLQVVLSIYFNRDFTSSQKCMDDKKVEEKRYRSILTVSTVFAVPIYLGIRWIVGYRHPVIWVYCGAILILIIAGTLSWSAIFSKKRRMRKDDREGKLHFKSLLRLHYMLFLTLLIFFPPWMILMSARPLKEKNILLIVIDTLRANHLGCYGYKRSTTPNINRLAKGGVLFTNAYSQSSWTKTSIASLMTGAYPYRHNVFYENGDYSALPKEVVTIAEVLLNSGYKTVGFSANPHIIPEFGFSQGFSSFQYDILWRQNSTEVVTEIVINYLRRRKGLKSTFMYVHYLDPHDTYTPSLPCEEFSHAYQPDNPAVRDGEAYTLSGARSLKTKLHMGVIPTPYPMSSNDLEFLMALYDCEISQVDEGVGRILATLEDIGAMDNTIIIVTSDHGEGFLEHGMLTHGYQLFNETVKIPLIIYEPGSPYRSLRYDNPVELIGVFPTILSLLGITFSGDIDGNILPPFESSSTSQDDSIAFGITRFRKQDKAFLLQGDWKIIRDFVKAETSLFNIAEDPLEKVDVVDDNPDIVNNMSRRMVKIIRRPMKPISSVGFSQPDNPILKERLRSLGYLY
ncbi:MAG: hypothetical protein A3G93_00335 [Nitrospinae bacterium RIFCSPLOWO2_12_FULL_45_22]|nr:MAG: hypothetical protein A3G93_00335 [Nitrospinae bacterium RIFCSPLOWO2_12_FULL_45_22]